MFDNVPLSLRLAIREATVFLALENEDYSYALLRYLHKIEQIPARQCNITAKSLCYNASDRSHQQISLSPRAARPTQSAIFPRSVSEYRKILGSTPGHRG